MLESVGWKWERLDIREVAVKSVALPLELFGELELVVVLQDGVGDDDQGDVKAHSVQDRSRAYPCKLSHPSKQTDQTKPQDTHQRGKSQLLSPAPPPLSHT